MKKESIPFKVIRKIVKNKYTDNIIFTVFLFNQKRKNKENTT